MSWRRRRQRWRRAGGRPAPAARTGDAARPSGARWCRARSPPQRPRPAANKPNQTAAAAQRGLGRALRGSDQPAESAARTRTRHCGAQPILCAQGSCALVRAACPPLPRRSAARRSRVRAGRRVPKPGAAAMRCEGSGEPQSRGRCGRGEPQSRRRCGRGEPQSRGRCGRGSQEASTSSGLGADAMRKRQESGAGCNEATAGTIPRTRLAPRERQNAPRPASSTACVAAEVPLGTCSCAPSCLAAATAAHARTPLRRPMPAPPRS